MKDSLVIQEKNTSPFLPGRSFLQSTMVRVITDYTGHSAPVNALPKSRFCQDFSQVAVHAESGTERSGLASPFRLQAKLTIGQPDDEYEREADRVADQVMQMPEPTAHRPASDIHIQRACPRCDELRRQPADEDEKKREDADEQLQAKPAGGVPLQNQAAGASIAPPLVHEVLNSPGHPLDPATRAFMEPRFGYDFSHVRVHNDAMAAESARAVNALAYTVGRDVVFGAGQYAPGNHAGKQLVAHEMAHVIQQHGVERQARPRCQSVDRPTLTSAGQTKLARWNIKGDEATVTRQGDNLWTLAQRLTGHGMNWSCIWPKETKSGLTWGEDYSRYIQPGDKFDISNLTRTEGPSATLTFYNPSDEFLEAVKTLYGGTNVFDLEAQIGNLAGYGATPIKSLTVCGHSGRNLMWGGLSSFSASNYKPEEPNPSGASAHSKSGPHRCWFTRNAVVRFVGCSSAEIGSAFARVFLRDGAAALGTRQDICGWFTPPSLRYMTVQGSPCKHPRGQVYFSGARLNSAGGLWGRKEGGL